MEEMVVLGGSGFVGGEISEFFSCPATSASGKEGFVKCDATDVSDLRRVLERFRPKVVVNCIGLADVDRAETDRDLARRLNTDSVYNIVSLQNELGFRLVHISTDYVFDGSRGNYSEADEPSPVNVYGSTKLEGEKAALANPLNLILRISSPFGRERGTTKMQFFRFVYNSLRQGRTVSALRDQIVTATYLPDLSRAIRRLVQSEGAGVFHVTSTEALSRFDFAMMVARLSGLDASLVVPATVGDMKQWKARRPLNTSLSVSKSISAGVSYTKPELAVRELLNI
ncbi:MAG: SDR family oxidoreductase [Thermoplasmata archaeon]|uniref:SDR family oxidoreductase n=1 Tax=Candidatus Sysuiplasma superficiale TaxID=2823368 RepID=A0A8J7YVG5_9ARCH|nr:SDR family oxidoreductase [Candidatus Sysuiplasma superficiale]MBX8644897.1 SDR family oxidoreductase [Candidatus Sysuiplasma superficiale]